MLLTAGHDSSAWNFLWRKRSLAYFSFSNLSSFNSQLSLLSKNIIPNGASVVTSPPTFWYLTFNHFPHSWEIQNFHQIYSDKASITENRFTTPGNIPFFKWSSINMIHTMWVPLKAFDFFLLMWSPGCRKENEHIFYATTPVSSWLIMPHMAIYIHPALGD